MMDGHDTAISIHLLVRGEEPPIIIDVRPEPTVFGRYDPEAIKQPDIDLTRHGAHDEGVSRLHAELLVFSNRVCIQDLSSRNGTFVNNEKLAPYIEHPLYDGDWVRLGRLKILVNFTA